MARAAGKAKTPIRPASPSKRPVGRPPGSKNKVTSKVTGKVAAARVSKPAPVPIRKNAAVASKLSKADLEVQVAKLERALALSRNKVAELKRMMSDADARAEQAAIAKPAALVSKQKPVKQKPAQQKLAATRSRRKKAEAVEEAEPDEQHEPVLDEATGEAETEAHAS